MAAQVREARDKPAEALPEPPKPEFQVDRQTVQSWVWLSAVIASVLRACRCDRQKKKEEVAYLLCKASFSRDKS